LLHYVLFELYEEDPASQRYVFKKER
jgi:hypothetical protein